MYCPNCGKSDQKADTYCRQCGEYLPDPDSTSRKQTPAEQFRITIVFNVLSALAAFSMAVALIATFAGEENVPGIIWAAVSLFLVIGIWQAVSFFNNLKLRKRFISKGRGGKEGMSAETGDLGGINEAEKALPEADDSMSVPSSVTEHTTRRLKERRRSR